MSSYLKLKISNMVIPPNSASNNVLKILSSMQIIRNGDNNFLLEVPSDSQLSCLKEHEGKLRIVESNNQTVKLSIDRSYFIKTVIKGIHEKPSIITTPKKIVLDYSSPNIAKPFHVGHLRSTIIGNFIANINKHFENNITRINYLGDWGTQFGLLQYSLKTKNISFKDLESNPIKKLFELYVYANQLAAKDENVLKEARKNFADIEQGLADLEYWKKIREVTVRELTNVYQRLGIQFDEYHWESDYNGNAIKNTIALLENRNIISIDESGKKVAKVGERNVTVLKSDNSTLYISRDIAALLDRYSRYKFDQMLYIVDNAQTDHFGAVFEIVKQLDCECANRCKHIKFGRIKGISTRTGNVVFLNDILDKAKQKLFEMQSQAKNTRIEAKNEKTWDILGTTAVLINDFKKRRQRDYLFDWDKALQSEGDSGIKLQYLHCRLWSLEQNCGVTLPEECDPNYLPEPIVADVIAELANFDNILLRAQNECEACILLSYLFKLAKRVNSMYNLLGVKNVSKDLAAQRLLVFHTARVVVKTGLQILGVKPLNEM